MSVLGGLCVFWNIFGSERPIKYFSSFWTYMVTALSNLSDFNKGCFLSLSFTPSLIFHRSFFLLGISVHTRLTNWLTDHEHKFKGGRTNEPGGNKCQKDPGKKVFSFSDSILSEGEREGERERERVYFFGPNPLCLLDGCCCCLKWKPDSWETRLKTRVPERFLTEKRHLVHIIPNIGRPNLNQGKSFKRDLILKWYLSQILTLGSVVYHRHDVHLLILCVIGNTRF